MRAPHDRTASSRCGETKRSDGFTASIGLSNDSVTSPLRLTLLVMITSRSFGLIADLGGRLRTLRVPATTAASGQDRSKARARPPVCQMPRILRSAGAPQQYDRGNNARCPLSRRRSWLGGRHDTKPLIAHVPSESRRTWQGRRSTARAVDTTLIRKPATAIENAADVYASDLVPPRRPLR